MALSQDCDPARVFLIGDATDQHVSTVLARLPKEGTVVIDAATLPSALYRLTPEEGTSSTWPVSRSVYRRKWLLGCHDQQ
ncbi:hypothetical protein KVH31_34245 [Streptomyces olivaceus]|uniref:hypothetical protein n=1 Tax=Streptomyces olivaceus TaxID=47716 RepID=UPI0008784895|nr:hypothetical protein [Streptomyces olivaceus]AOW85171.1 hypothetical protein BC342_00065 [Streptomyces olivaceus]MBZ6211558.1 hypothetical protein [Streptomyces olivaceus]